MLRAYLLPQAHIQIVLRLVTTTRPFGPAVGMAGVQGLNEFPADWQATAQVKTPAPGCVNGMRESTGTHRDACCPSPAGDASRRPTTVDLSAFSTHRLRSTIWLYLGVSNTDLRDKQVREGAGGEKAATKGERG